MSWSSLEITAASDEVRFGVRARPRSSRSAIEGVQGGRAVIALRSAPDRGAANQELVALVAAALGVPKSWVRVVRGEASRDKVIGVRGLAEGDLRARLGAL